MTIGDPREDTPIVDEPPPVLGSWPSIYCFVLAYLAAVIILFWLFTKHYAP